MRQDNFGNALSSELLFSIDLSQLRSEIFKAEYQDEVIDCDLGDLKTQTISGGAESPQPRRERRRRTRSMAKALQQYLLLHDYTAEVLCSAK